MKKHILWMAFLAFWGIQQVGAQQYKTAADTVQLNKEHTEVSNEIAMLNAKLTIARNNMPGYQNKASESASDAQNAAAANRVQADIATGQTVKEARKSKRKAKKAVHEAKDARSAASDMKEHQQKINSLSAKLDQKTERLKELELMRSRIVAQQPIQ